MPYKGESYEGEKLRQEMEKSVRLQSEVSEETQAKATKLQWVYSSFNDPGDDWCRADFYSKEGTLLQSVVVPGY